MTVRTFAVILVLATPLAAQVQWTEFPARTSTAMSEDNSGVSPRLVVFGGVSLEGTVLNDTQALATTSSSPSWQALQTTSTPPPTSKHAMANLPGVGVVLFGGQTNATTLSPATWIFHGNSWSQVGSSIAPTPRVGHAMVLDESRNRIVLYGGRDANNVLLSDTWEFDGTTWTQLFPAVSPGPMADHSMAFQPATNTIVLVIGISYPFVNIPAWRYDGATATWSTIPNPPVLIGGLVSGYRLVRLPGSNTVAVFGGLADGPVPPQKLVGNTWIGLPILSQQRQSRSITYDPASDRVYVRGGTTSGSLPAHTTLVWDGTGAVLLDDEVDPDGRAGHALLTDANHQRLHLLGGNNNDVSYYGYSPFEMWERSAGRWHPMTLSPAAAADAPSPPSGVRAAYDSDRARIVAIDAHGTTEWDGQSWQRVSTSPSPAATHLVYHSPSKRTVAVTPGTETWLWNGTDWSLALPAHPPKFGGATYLALDPVNDAVLLFSPGKGTWLWDGIDWQAQSSTTMPPAANWYITTDAYRHRVVLSRAAATWEWDGATWIQRTLTGVTPPTDGALGFDPELGRVVFFANSGSTFEYATTAISFAAPYGVGCPGSRGIPSMWTDLLPWRGDTARFVIDDAPGASLGILGLDNMVWGSVPLPADLSPIGMPGCTLYQSLDTLQFLPQSTWSLAIPNLASSVGLQFYVQAFVPDAGAGNPFLGTMSNAVVNVIGEK